jgi:hypothetical protein
MDPTSYPVPCAKWETCDVETSRKEYDRKSRREWGTPAAISREQAYRGLLCRDSFGKHAQGSHLIHLYCGQKVLGINHLLDINKLPSDAYELVHYVYEAEQWRINQRIAQPVSSRGLINPYCGRIECLFDVLKRYGLDSIQQIVDALKEDPSRARSMFAATSLPREVSDNLELVIEHVEQTRTRADRKQVPTVSSPSNAGGCRSPILILGILAAIALSIGLAYILGRSSSQTTIAVTATPAATSSFVATDASPTSTDDFVPVVLNPTPPPNWDSVYVEYILDASGSMLEQMDGQRKIDIAKEVLAAKAGQLPSTTNVGLRAYGHRIPYTDTEASCRDIELLVPLRGGSRDNIIERLPDLEAQGMTPLSEAVKQSVEDFDHADPSRQNSVILISDGEETCGGDPCAMADELVNTYGISFTMYVIAVVSLISSVS